MPEAPARRARALLVEDDASIRHFVALALEDEPLELLQAGTLGEALARLQSDGPFALILTDLMLPDGNGAELLQAMVAQPALRGTARVVVYSAGLTAESRGRLLSLGVDETLEKPTPLAELVRTARLALDPAAAPAPAQPDRAQAAIEHYFCGDRALFEAFRESCRQQFGADRRSGDAAVAAADWPALRRLAHSLKTVLRTLGCDEAGAVAKQLEDDAALGNAAAAGPGWRRLAEALDAIAPR